MKMIKKRYKKGSFVGFRIPGASNFLEGEVVDSEGGDNKGPYYSVRVRVTNFTDYNYYVAHSDIFGLIDPDTPPIGLVNKLKKELKEEEQKFYYPDGVEIGKAFDSLSE